jgi:NAD-dependent SIR2 family protein deacetylase
LQALLENLHGRLEAFLAQQRQHVSRAFSQAGWRTRVLHLRGALALCRCGMTLAAIQARVAGRQTAHRRESDIR